MGYYVELACDVAGPNCAGFMADNPQGPTVPKAKQEGRRAGWLVGPGRKAVCPACRAAPSPKEPTL